MTPFLSISLFIRMILPLLRQAASWINGSGSGWKGSEPNAIGGGKKQVLRCAQDDNSLLDAAREKCLLRMASKLNHYRING
jgi:hypothetical protein